MNLPDDGVNDFAMVVDYIIKGDSSKFARPVCPEPSPIESVAAYLEVIRIIRYTECYGVPEACDTLYPDLPKIKVPTAIQPEDIVLIFNLFKKNHRFRGWILAALSPAFLAEDLCIMGKFHGIKDVIPDFDAEMIAQMMKLIEEADPDTLKGMFTPHTYHPWVSKLP